MVDFTVGIVIGGIFGVWAGYLTSRFVFRKRVDQLVSAYGYDKVGEGEKGRRFFKLKNDDPFSNVEAVMIASSADFGRRFWAGKMEETMGGVWVDAEDLESNDIVEVRRFDVSEVASRKSPDGMNSPKDRKGRQY